MGELKRYLAQAEAWLGAKKGDGVYEDMLAWFNKNPKGIKADTENCSEFTVACALKSIGIKQAFIPVASTANAQSKMWKKLSSTPSVGSLMYFDYKDGLGISHVEIVTDVRDGTVFSINGNSNHRVVRCSRKTTNRYIAGYGVPDWPREGEDMTAWQKAAIGQIVLKKGSRGTLVKWLQEYLQRQGFYLKGNIDMLWGNYMDSEFERFQQKNGLYVDRICGQKCWEFILK